MIYLFCKQLTANNKIMDDIKNEEVICEICSNLGEYETPDGIIKQCPCQEQCGFDETLN